MANTNREVLIINSLPAEVVCEMAQARKDFYAGLTPAGRMFLLSPEDRAREVARMDEVMRAVGCK